MYRAWPSSLWNDWNVSSNNECGVQYSTIRSERYKKYLPNQKIVMFCFELVNHLDKSL